MKTTPTTTRPICISEAIYRKLAKQLEDGIDNAYDGDPEECYKTDSIEYSNGAFTAILIVDLLVYRHTERAPDGDFHPIDDLVPIWCELCTSFDDDDQEMLNDFDFNKLKKYIC